MQHRSRHAFTLLESLAASVVLALAVVGVSGALIASQQQTRVEQDDAVIVSLGRQLTEKIASLPFTLSDGTTGVSGFPRTADASQYDTLDDFAGYRDVVSASCQREQRSALDTSTSGAEPTVSALAAGAAVPTLSPTDFLRSVSITYPTSAFGAPVVNGELAIITVNIRNGSGAAATFTRAVFKWTGSR